MFTGIVEEIGRIRQVSRSGPYQRFTVEAQRVLAETQEGDSIAIDGVCQTVTTIGNRSFSVEALEATLTKTTLGSLQVGNRVNLERALTPTTRMGGHIVQGHVDGTGTVASIREDRRNVYFTVALPEHLIRFCIDEGSIAIDGVSLTVATLGAGTITVNVIPTTWNETVLADRRPGAPVNIEVDVLARYVARLLQGRSPHHRGTIGSKPNSEAPITEDPLTEESLRAWGY